MFLKIITKKGVPRLYLYESYYKNGKSNQHCIESLGRLDELVKQFDDPVSHFRKLAEERTAEQKAAGKTSVPIDTTQTMDISEDNLKNVSYAVLKELYKQLELDKFWRNILKKNHPVRPGSRLPASGVLTYPLSRLQAGYLQ